MGDAGFRRFESERVLFIWDRTKGSALIADRFVASSKDPYITVATVMPHESLCAYRTVGDVNREPSSLERRLAADFKKAVKSTKHLKRAKFEILFGERIVVTSRLASIIKVDCILMPCFTQSRFSTWLHGDLNKRMTNRASCKVVFYDSTSKKLGSFDTEKSQVNLKSDPLGD